MENEILNDIMVFARKRLTAAYGYCGIASSPNKVWIDTTDKKGGDIKIIIELTKEKESSLDVTEIDEVILLKR